LRASKRKQINKERRSLADTGVTVELIEGDALGEEHEGAMWRFYASTLERKFSEAYLNRATFARLFESFRHRLVLILARDGRGWMGGALHVRKGSGLYGRYWGSDRHVPGLHFECCYYRAIDYAIANGLSVVEAGAQGEHKFLRGFVARPIYSAHWVAHPNARAAIAEALDSERTRALEVIRGYNEVSPVKAVRGGAF
jgi:predicted N-acyltransferase